MRKCEVDGCERKHVGKGMCGMHSQRFRKHGTTERQVYVPKVCTVDGCDRQAIRKGWCDPHYLRWYRTGTVLGKRTRVLTGPARKCEIPGCGRTHAARGWCLMHLRRWERTGNPYRAGNGRAGSEMAAQRRAQVVVMTKAGWSLSQMAQQLGVTVRTASRLRVQARELGELGESDD